MQVVETLPPDRTLPAVLTVAIHVVVAYVLAISVGVLPTPAPFEPARFVDIPPPPVVVAADPIRVDPNALKVVTDINSQNPPPEFLREIPFDGPGDVVINVGGILEPPVIAPQISNVRLVKGFDPPYPNVSRRLGEEGVVYVRASITPYGTIGDIVIEKSSGFPRLDEAALKAVREWRFAPAMRGTQAIAGSVTVPVRFELQRR